MYSYVKQILNQDTIIAMTELYYIYVFLVSVRDLACQQEVSLALTKTPPIHYYNVVDSAFSNYAG